jgi:signal transduction histidine kinase
MISGGDRASGLRHPARLAAALAVATAIFLIDTFTTLESAVAVLYVVVLLIADDGIDRRPVLASCAVSAALAVLSFWLIHAVDEEAGALLRLAISLSAVGMATALIIRNQKLRASTREVDLRYRTIFDTLAVAIWEHDFTELAREIAVLKASGVDDIRSFLHANPDFVIRMRRTVMLGNANETARTLLRVPAGQPFFTRLTDILPDDDDSFLEGIVKLSENARLFEAETRLRTWSGDYIDVFVALSFPSGMGLDRICASVTDITERKRIQSTLDRTRSELDHAIRVATVGEMSSSIAHEVSQPLTAIHTYAEAARRWLARTPPNVSEAQSAIRQAVREAANAGAVVGKVRQLVNRAPAEMVSIPIDEVISTAAQLAGRQFGSATISLRLGAGDARIRGDAVLIQQLIANMISNSVEAALGCGRKGVWVTIATRIVDDALHLRVFDDGPGLADEDLQRAFAPFFTTREDGVGLGLTICRSIVETHGGSISLIANDPGARIDISLPLAPRELARDQRR